MSRPFAAFILATLALAPGLVAAEKCPAVVIDALKQAYPDGKLTRCVAETERGQKQFEAKVSRGKDRLEIDVSPAGVILLVEEPFAVADLPAAVARAFATRYPKAKPTRADKMTAGASVSYEIGFHTDAGRREATFTTEGTFVEEE